MNGTLNYIFKHLNGTEEAIKVLAKVALKQNKALRRLSVASILTGTVLWIQDREIRYLRTEIKELKKDIKETKRTMEGD